MSDTPQTPTPLTDSQPIMAGNKFAGVPIDFARDLERRLAAAEFREQMVRSSESNAHEVIAFERAAREKAEAMLELATNEARDAVAKVAIYEQSEPGERLGLFLALEKRAINAEAARAALAKRVKELEAEIDSESKDADLHAMTAGKRAKEIDALRAENERLRKTLEVIRDPRPSQKWQADIVDAALAGKDSPKHCRVCGTKLEMSAGWTPTPNDPDNAGLAPTAEPYCPKCDAAKGTP